MKSAGREAIRRAFALFDCDGDGSITGDELAAALQHPSTGHPFTGDEAQALIRRFDKNGDGVLDMEEFVRAFSSIAPHLDHSTAAQRGRDLPRPTRLTGARLPARAPAACQATAAGSRSVGEQATPNLPTTPDVLTAKRMWTPEQIAQLEATVVVPRAHSQINQLEAQRETTQQGMADLEEHAQKLVVATAPASSPSDDRTPTPFEAHAEALHAAIASASSPRTTASDERKLTYKTAAEYASKARRRHGLLP